MSNIQLLNINSKAKEIDKHLENNGYPGKFCGFNCLHNHYTHKSGGVTDWTGFPGSGKTYFAFEVMFNLAERYGLRTALYTPDMGSYIDLVAKLVKMQSGMDFNDKYKNKVDVKTLYESIPFLTHHFPIIEKKDIKKPLSPIDIWEFVCDYKDEGGGIIHNVLIDSWKNLYHDYQPYGGREYAYLDSVLSYRNELALKYNRHFHTIAHAVKTELQDDESGGKKKRRIPDANDIKGGAAWYANGMNIITVDFPDKTAYGVDLYISKTKPEDVGKMGAVINKLYLDAKKGRYFEYLNGGKSYGNEASKNPPAPLPQNQITPNLDFSTGVEETKDDPF